MPNVAQSSSSSTSSKPSTVGGISLASIIRRPQSTGFYVDMSTAPPPATAATTQQTQQCAAADRRSTSTEGRSGSPGRVADRSHLFSMFIDFAEPSIHSPAKRAAAAPTASTGTGTDDVTGVVQLRRRAERALDSAGTASSRQSWSNCGATDAGVFSFDTMPAGAGGGAHGTNMTELEDSCTASVVSADHGYQSMPMQLAGRPSRSRNSVQSLDHSTNSMGSSREDLTAGVRGALAAVVAAAPQPPARKSRRTLHQQKQQQQRRHPDHDDHNEDDDLELERYSKDSVESLCRRESSFSDAEEATGVRADRRSSSTHSSYGDQLDGLHSAANVGSKLPVVSHQLRKNNSLSHVGEQMLLRAANRNQPHAATATAATGDGHPQHVQHHPHHHQSGHTMETLQATMERQQKLLLLETVNEETPLSSFVKLSDMDRQPERATDGSAAVADAKLMSRSSGPGGKVMERAASVGRSSMSRSMGTNLGNLASSEDTLRSLSRLFPHLSQELALSPTAECCAPPCNTVPDRASSLDRHRNGSGHSVDHSDYNLLSDLSAVSSVASSCSRSGVDSADEWSLSSRQPRRLGEDLLKMFLQEIATDVTLDVAGRPIRAHKCILRSRCQYFAAMLAGNREGVDHQQQQQRIQLAGYSFGSVHFALCHIYSGAAHPPQGISLFELAALSDMLALEGLKEVTTHALRSHYCHNFHKPCSGCIDGIMRVFPVTLQHGLDELYHKCLRWTCKHYVTVWSTRAFALLPADLIERCVQYVVAHVNSETVLTLLLNCDSLITMLSSCRWAIGVENTVRDLIDTARAYVADHFANLLASDCFLSLGQDQCANIARLENLLLRTASTLTPEQACRSYQRVHRLNGALRAKVKQTKETAGGSGGGGVVSSESSTPTTSSLSSSGDNDADTGTWNAEFLRFVEAILLAIEHCLTRQCARAMRTQQWQRMELELRKRIQGLACLTDSMESKRSSKNHPLEATAGWTNHHQVPDMHEVKLAIETLSKRSKEGRYPSQRIERMAKADPNLDKVTKLRKPTAVPHLTARPHTIHVAKSQHPVDSQAPPHNPRLFKHSHSLDVPVSHRPPLRHSAAVPPTASSNMHPIAKSSSTAARFAEIRPRYLEPKTRLSTQSVDNLVRTSNQALNQRASQKSINSLGLSRDSLSTAASHKQASAVARPKQYRSQTIMSQDSLNSRRSAQQQQQQHSQPPNQQQQLPCRSMSRDSLAKSNSMTRLRRPANSSTATSKSDDPISPVTSNGTTTRSSRLSSGYLNSPRDSNAAAAAGGVGARKSAALAAIATSPRKSFISAKSREILAKRASALGRAESLRVGPSSTVSSSNVSHPRHAAAVSGGLNKSSSTSNIPTGGARVRAVSSCAPTPMHTTLHLRRTARLPSEAASAAPSSVAVRYTGMAKKAAQTASNMQIKRDMQLLQRGAAKTTAVAAETDKPTDEHWIEPRMERSMTFCKDSSDLDLSTLTIVE